MTEIRANSGCRRRLAALPVAVLGLALQGCARTPMLMTHPAALAEPPPTQVVPVYAAPQIQMESPPPPPPVALEMSPPATDTGPDSPGEGPPPARSAPIHKGAVAASNQFGEREEAPAEGPPVQRVYCDVSRTFTSAEECTYFTTVKAKASNGLGAVQFPDTITRGETRKVSFIINAAPAKATSAQLLGSAPSQEFALKVTGRMRAMLQGEGFKIAPASAPTQDIGISDAARWDWDVTALKAPHHKLTLTAYMVVQKPDGSQSEEALPSVQRDIPVKVTWGQSFSDFVESMVALSDSAKALIAALTALVVALLAFKGKLLELAGPFLRKGSPAPPPQQG